MGDRIKEAHFNVSSAPSFLLSLSQKDRRALVEDGLNRRLITNVIKALGRNAVEGKERFFASPYYWKFNVEKPFILQQTLERRKAAGMVYHLLDKAAAIMHSTYLAEGIQAHVLTEPVPGGGDTNDPVGFSDSIIAETFVLFLYLIAACIILTSGAFFIRLSCWKRLSLTCTKLQKLSPK